MSELSYYPGLIQRGSVFHYRKRVPTDIVGSFGRREIWTSLDTGNRQEAVKRARRVAVKLDDRFDAHRNGQAEPFEVEELSQEAINRLAELRFQQVVTEHDASRLKAMQEVAVVADLLVRNEGAPSDAPEEPAVTGDLPRIMQASWPIKRLFATMKRLNASAIILIAVRSLKMESQHRNHAATGS